MIPVYDLDEVTGINDNCIDKSSVNDSHLFNNTWLIKYPYPRKVVFDNISEFKQDFIPLIKDFDIKTVLTSTKNPQANSPVEQVHQLLLNMLVNKDLDNKVFDDIYPWSETLEYIAWSIRVSWPHQAKMSFAYT